MFGRFVQWMIRLTHIPTGISVQTDSTARRGMHDAKDRTMLRLKSRVWAHQNIDRPSAKTAYSYDLDRLGVDGYNDDLLDMRKSIRIESDATNHKD